MRSRSFPLGRTEDNRMVRLLRILFGVACLAMGIYWVIYILTEEYSVWSLWISILFLFAFGGYQVWAGLGKAFRYIEISEETIKLKKFSIREPEILIASDISAIYILPMSIVFLRKDGNKTLLRLGAVHYETNENIVDELASFAERNNIRCEIKADEL